MGRLRNLLDILKDKASLIKATLSPGYSIHVAVLRATPRGVSAHPSEKLVAAILAFGDGSRLTACSCVGALMDRLHDTHSASVALKCLLLVHNIIARGSFILKDQLSFYPSSGGRNFLNLSMFRDNSDVEMWELSSWVRWYAEFLEQNFMVSRVVGYYLWSSSSSSSSTNDSEDKEGKLVTLLNSDLLKEIDVFVNFAEQICGVPDSLHLQRNNLVYEVVRMVGEDYRLLQSEIYLRVEELGSRMGNLNYNELTQLLTDLKRFEDCKERFLLVFVNRKKNDGLWDLISRTKTELSTTMKKKTEEMKLVVMGGMGRREESTRFRNSLAESGSCIGSLQLVQSWA